jgi:SAM-dependent methyltransferase
MTIHEADAITTAVRDRYAELARTASSCCGPSASGLDPFGQSQYGDDEKGLLPQEALLASLGCGNPTALAQLNPGEVVLDLGSGGGIDVLLSARRVSPGGKAYGLDMTPEMLELANANKARSGLDNVEFLLGTIEHIPLPDDSVDVIISNCVVNLSADKDAVFREALRVLKPGGRFAISDMVLSRELSPQLTGIMALWTGCIAGALTERDCTERMLAAGFENVSIEPTTIFGRSELERLADDLRQEDIPAGVDVEQAVTEFDGVIRSAFIRATKPRTDIRTMTEESHMPAVRVYEPALCCNTGVCGTDLDQDLVDFTADLNHLEQRGADISRHNLANDPTAFAADENVRAFLQVAGSDGLPLTTVDGVTVMTGSYPTRDQLVKFAGLSDEPAIVPAGITLLNTPEGDSCGCGPAGCC